MVRISVEEAIEFDSKGWIVGSSITSRAGWMLWVKPFEQPTVEELKIQEKRRYDKAVELWKDLDRKTSTYFEIIERWPLILEKEHNRCQKTK